MQLQHTPKPAYIIKRTDHIVLEESPKDVNYKLGDVEEYHIVEEPLSQTNCVDLKYDGGDEIVKHGNKGKASNDDYNPGKAIDVSNVFTTDELIASTSNGSPAGRRRSGKSSVFSLFNLKERSKFWSEAVIRGDFDDLESSSPGKMGAFNYTKADNRTV
ncbi:hypothetical protein LguiB_020706 [Lonicera macranthoides]